MSVSQHRTAEGLQRPRRSKKGPGTSASVTEPKDFLSAHVTHWWVLNSTELLLNRMRPACPRGSICVGAIQPRYNGSLPAAADFVIVVVVVIVLIVRHHAEIARNGRLTYVSTLVNAGQQKKRALPAGVGDGVTQVLNGGTLPTDAAHRLALCESDSLPALCRAAAELRDRGKGRITDLFSQGFHSSDPTLSRLLWILHVSPISQRIRIALHDDRRSGGGCRRLENRLAAPRPSLR